jgi:hypothetical protein
VEGGAGECQLRLIDHCFQVMAVEVPVSLWTSAPGRAQHFRGTTQIAGCPRDPPTQIERRSGLRDRTQRVNVVTRVVMRASLSRRDRSLHFHPASSRAGSQCAQLSSVDLWPGAEAPQPGIGRHRARSHERTGAGARRLFRLAIERASCGPDVRARVDRSRAVECPRRTLRSGVASR